MKRSVVAALALIAAPALADPAPSQSATPKKICRRDDQEVGTIIASKPICHTRSEWQAIDTKEAKRHSVSAAAPPNVALDALVTPSR